MDLKSAPNHLMMTWGSGLAAFFSADLELRAITAQAQQSEAADVLLASAAE